MYECNTGIDCNDCSGCENNLETSLNLNVAKFQDAEINFETEYHNIRKLMEIIGTDLGALSYNTTLMYVAAPEKWLKPYYQLIDEIDQRKNMLEIKMLFNNLGL